jgi:hypothetical protein
MWSGFSGRGGPRPAMVFCPVGRACRCAGTRPVRPSSAEYPRRVRPQGELVEATVHIAQRDEPYRVSVELEFVLSEGRTQRVRVPLSAAQQDLVVPLAEPPSAVRLDPGLSSVPACGTERDGSHAESVCDGWTANRCLGPRRPRGSRARSATSSSVSPRRKRRSLVPRARRCLNQVRATGLRRRDRCCCWAIRERIRWRQKPYAPAAERVRLLEGRIFRGGQDVRRRHHGVAGLLSA